MEIFTSQAATPPLDPPVCENCKGRMRLVGIEWETETRDIYTFECQMCRTVTTKSVAANQ